MLEFNPITLDDIHRLRTEIYFSTDWTQSEREYLFGIIENAFRNSDTFRDMLNRYLRLNYNDGVDNHPPFDAVRADGLEVAAGPFTFARSVISIKKATGLVAHTARSIEISLTSAYLAYDIDLSGKAFKYSFEHIFLHELGHLLGDHDDWSGESQGSSLTVNRPSQRQPICLSHLAYWYSSSTVNSPS